MAKDQISNLNERNFPNGKIAYICMLKRPMELIKKYYKKTVLDKPWKIQEREREKVKNISRINAHLLKTL